jgi:serine/threonine-protein kinase
MTRSLITLEQGQLLAGRYRLLRPLGSGGSAHVWAARDESLGREVALKVLSGSTAQGGHERERLEREARLLATLDHPRLTTVFDFAETDEPDGDNHPFLVTELLGGESLDARLARGPLPPEDAMSVCAQVADALAAAHEAGVVHRDVKPGNVMLGPDGAKLLDFGISRRQADDDLTGQVLIGTPACMAPEQWRVGRAEPASDVYALGCLLYWCMSGHGPYAGHELTALGMAHLLADPPALPLTGPRRAAIDEIYEACMRKDPAERPSAGEVAAVLEGRAQPQSPLPQSQSSQSRLSQSRLPQSEVPFQSTVATATHRPFHRTHLAAYVASAGVTLVGSLALTLALANGSSAGQASTGSGSAQSHSSATSAPAAPTRSAPTASPIAASATIGAGPGAIPSSGATPNQGTTKTKNSGAGHHHGHGNGDS